MAINKKLIHFQTMANFEVQLSAGNILDTSIVFIKDAKKIWTHGEFYNCDDGGEISWDDIQDKPDIPTKLSELDNDDGYIKKDVAGNVSLNEYIATDFQYLIAHAIKGSDGGIMLVNKDGSISTVDHYDDNKLDIKTSGDGTKLLNDKGKYTAVKTINGNSILGSGNIVISSGITAETDPIFSASPAATITEEKIAEWGGKQDKTKCFNITPSAGNPLIIRPETNSYYSITNTANDIYVFLPDLLTPVDHVEHIMLNVKFGSTPNIQFIPGAGYGGTVRAAESFSIEPDSWYEISIINAGNGWIVSNIKLNDAIINSNLPSGNPTAVSSEEDELNVVEE